ncbi:hypothetical protein GJ654_12495 [Rhodoblastus acidophilus]|uniref:Uncharacterized protein n=1 Tax=Rhodoblastus acidophilus TaxID=1074 RepID=A0A6N8DQI2_RHOAC|nr:hypothetical protein [Rhodoblastus acidophilus]MCW2275302.1 hypothetical protein [Rhodoblastus acidophilus]MTV31805.1 hypothetical protein [Rhodoblastus acidophilus]
MTPERYIEPEWLDAVRGKLFYYPAAYEDWAEPLAVFQDYISTFWFCDIHYERGLRLGSVFGSDPSYRLVDSEITGAPLAELSQRVAADGRHYRFLEPSKLWCTYERGDGRQIVVVRRRGFGQMTLTKEFDKGALGVFMHRGDSTGEGGSNVFFLSNSKTVYEPCGNLFKKISYLLSDQALIISDGSNTSIEVLKQFFNRTTSGRDAFLHHLGKQFSFGGFLWRCVGWLKPKGGPTLVWGLTREATTQGFQK